MSKLRKAIKKYAGGSKGIANTFKNGGFIVPPRKRYDYGTPDASASTGASTNAMGGYVALASSIVSSIPTERDEQNINPRNKNIEGIYGVAEQIPYAGQYIQLGRGMNQKFEDAASKETNQTNKDILNYQAGSVDPLSEWSKNAALYDEGAISTEQWMGNTALHLLSPGLASTQMDNQQQNYLNQLGKKKANSFAAERVNMMHPEMQNNQSAYRYMTDGGELIKRPNKYTKAQPYTTQMGRMTIYEDASLTPEDYDKMIRKEIKTKAAVRYMDNLLGDLSVYQNAENLELDKQAVNRAHPIFANGGIPNQVPVEYQGGEVVFLRKDNGTFLKYRNPKATKDNQHKNGGIQESLPEGSVIISKKFAKEAEQAYKNNDHKRIEALIQKQDRYNLSQGNPLDGTYGKYGLYVSPKMAKKYPYGTDDLKNILPETTVTDIAGSSGFAERKPFNSVDIPKSTPITLAQRSSANGPVMSPQTYSNPYGYALNEPGKNYGQTGPRLDNGNFSTNGNPGTNKKKRNYDWIGEAAKSWSTNRTNLNDVADKENYDKVDYGRVNPQYLNPWESIQENRRLAARTEYGVKNNSGGYAPGYMNNILANAAALRAQQAKTMADYDNANVGIYNQFLPINQEYKIRSMTDEAANKGAAHNIARAADAQISENTNYQMRDYNQKKQNDMLYQMYLDLYGKKGR